MTDRRQTPANGDVAHVSLKGLVAADRYVAGEMRHIGTIVADLCRDINGPRDRQLVRGEGFRALEIRDGWAFGFAERDGYVGWLHAADLIAPPDATTHRVAAARSYAKSTPGLKAMGAVTPLPFGARLAMADQAEGWARVIWSRVSNPRALYVPMQHLAPVGKVEPDAVAVAERLLGTPYLWGGNSAFGLDCSGLIQTALLACGIECPGDSDQQAAMLGNVLADTKPPKRGDLVFWQGHVGMMRDARTLIHANAHHMAVVIEPLAEATARIAASGGGDVVMRRRI
ncbi:MAG: C40 family peptidase [Rhodobacteraceae bacterium]|nr:C40 family peptidase [Paracoccaceae bacterium]